MRVEGDSEMANLRRSDKGGVYSNVIYLKGDAVCEAMVAGVDQTYPIGSLLQWDTEKDGGYERYMRIVGEGQEHEANAQVERPIVLGEDKLERVVLQDIRQVKCG